MMGGRRRRPRAFFILSLFLFLLFSACTAGENRKHSRVTVYGEPAQDRATRNEPIVKADAITAKSLTVKPSKVIPGGSVTVALLYSVLKEKRQALQVTEELTVYGKDVSILLLRKRINREQGFHTSALSITIPRDIRAGSYSLSARLTSAGLETTVTTRFEVKPAP
jgi:hypothetical protein